MNTPTLSIVIVNYKTPLLLQNCINSIYENTDSVSFEIIVVDNNSEDNSEIIIKNKFPKVNWFNSRYNAGFSIANNIGMKNAKGKFTLLLNSDTLVNENSIKKCLSYFESTSNIGVLGCKLLNENGSLQYSAYPEYHSLKKTLRANPFYIAFTKNKVGGESAIPANVTLHEPAWICGAFMMLSTDLIEEKKLYFDEDFFMYSEDVELCYRIKQEGLKIVYFPEASIIHLNGGSNSIKESRSAQIIISEWLCILKTKGRLIYLILLLFTFSNLILDSFFYKKSKFIKKTNEIDNKGKIYRIFFGKLVLKYGLKILFKYKKTPSSAKKQLKFHS